MASALTSPFHGLPIEEAVPLAADLTELKQSSILQGRRRIRFQPQTGVSATAGQIVQFVLSDSTGLLDVNSMVLSATIGLTGAAVNVTAPTAYNLLDEGASWCRRIQVLANGSLVEDIDNAHRAANMEVLASAESDWYKHDGSFCNFWKFNETMMIKDISGAFQNAVVAHAHQHSVDLSGVSYQAGWPLGLIAPSLRSNKYWPLRSMGELVLQFTLANNQEAIWSTVAGANTAYSLNDIFLECDIVVPHPAYASLLDRMTQAQTEAGLYLPVETRLVSQGQSIPAVSTTYANNVLSGVPTETNIVVSRATTNLRKVLYGVQPTQGLNNFAYPSVSCFPDEGCSAFQVRVGSLYFPSQPANSLARMFFMTSAAFGEPASTDKAAVYNRHNYDSTTLATTVQAQAAGTVFEQQPAAGGQFQGDLYNAGTVAAPVYRLPYSDFAPKGYCFDAYKNTSAPLANDGISILGNSGSQLIVIARHMNPEAVTPTIVLDATRVIVLKDGGLRIMGA